MSSRWRIVKQEIIQVTDEDISRLSSKLENTVQDAIDVGWTPLGSPVYLGKESSTFHVAGSDTQYASRGYHILIQAVVKWEEV